MADTLPPEMTKLVTPRAIRNYAAALGWLHGPGINGSISVYHQPDSDLHQLIVPLDESFDDYGESVAEAIRKLAAFEHRPPIEVLNHVLLPPSDVFRFSETGPGTDAGTLPFQQAVDFLDGTRTMLLSTAHSTLKPRAYHPRLSRVEAQQFVRNCRLGQTERGSFAFTVACPLEFMPGTQSGPVPYGRQVTHAMVDSLEGIVKEIEDNRVGDLADRTKYPQLSANFLEAMLLLRPPGDRSILRVSVDWSRALAPPGGSPRRTDVQLWQECFEVAEYLAPRLRAVPEPVVETFVGFVEVLRGQADPDGEMAGEVVFSITLDGGELIRVRADLTASDYQIAGDAHLKHEPVYFRGNLTRAPRLNRVERLTDFRRLELPTESAAS
jgi:hypothetical protein